MIHWVLMNTMETTLQEPVWHFHTPQSVKTIEEDKP